MLVGAVGLRSGNQPLTQPMEVPPCPGLSQVTLLQGESTAWRRHEVLLLCLQFYFGACLTQCWAVTGLRFYLCGERQTPQLLSA